MSKDTTYSHAYTLAFELVSADPEGKDVTPNQLVAALLKRVGNLITNDEVEEAIGCPYDTYDIPGDGRL